MWRVIVYVFMINHNGQLTLYQAFIFVEGAFNNLSVANQFHLCEARVANQIFAVNCSLDWIFLYQRKL